MKLLFSFAVVTLLSVSAFPVFSQETNTELVRVFREMNRAYGFCQGQSFSLNRTQEEFPELQKSVLITKLEWAAVFGKSCKTIENRLQLILADKWDSYREKVQTALIENSTKTQISSDQANTFLEIVKKRTKGEIESPVLETLLIFNPDFLENPVAEMSLGFKRTYRTENNSKAKGIDFQIEYPMSWAAIEGIRPNIIQNIKNYNGHGSTSIMLMVKDLPLFNGRKLTSKEIAQMFSPNYIKNLVPNDTIFISAKPITLDAQKGAMLVFDKFVERVDLKIRSRNVQFVTTYDNKMIMINCITGVENETLEELNERYKKLEPLFKAVANSFVIQSQYK
jgi:hypothetical protein